MAARSLLIVAISVIALFALSCEWLSTKHYNVDRLSPKGTYRVKVAVKVRDEGGFSGHFTDQGSLQVLKGQETVYEDQWNYRDNWDPSFIDRNPVIEWVGDNILRMGADNSGQPFTNELIVSNETSEHVKHFSLTCGKYENFDVFDLTPGSRVVLRPSPGLNLYTPDEIHLGYSAQTQSGKHFQGSLEQKQPNNSIKLEIKIRPEDIY